MEATLLRSHEQPKTTRFITVMTSNELAAQDRLYCTSIYTKKLFEEEDMHSYVI